MKIIIGGSRQHGSEFVASALALANHVVDRTDGEHEALELARTSACDAVVICPATTDGALGHAVASARTTIAQSAIIVMSSTTDPGAYSLFASGADDVITVRDGKHLLLARLTAVIRRAWGHSTAEIIVGALKIQLTRQACSVRGQAIALTPIEYRLMEALALRLGQVISRPTLLELLYRAGAEPLPKSIDLFAHNIRRKLAANDCAPCLATRRQGLVLHEDVFPCVQTHLTASAA